MRARSRHAKLLLGRITPVVYYGDRYPELSSEQQYEWSLLDTHDGLTDWYKRLLTLSEFRTMLAALQGDELWCAPGGNGIEGRLRRPTA